MNGLRCLDLFCGAGGFSSGLADAGFDIVAGCELDAWRREVWRRTHPTAAIYDDVRTLSGQQIRIDLGYLPDIVAGSPPCQEISSANSKGEGITDDHLFWDFVRICLEVRPLWCIAENSPRARTSGIDGICAALEAAGYTCWPTVVGADNAGANHKRKRMFLVAADADRLHACRTQSRRPQSTGTGSLLTAHDRRQGAVASRWWPAQSRHAEHTDDLEGLRQRGLGGMCRDQSAQTGLPLAGDTSSERCDGGAAAEADGRRQSGSESDVAISGHAADTDSPRHPERSDLTGVHGLEIPAALRDIGHAWSDWNGGLAGLTTACAAAGFGYMDDGTRTRFPPALRNRAIAALGDGVVRQTAAAIGRAIIEMMMGES